MLVLQYKLSEVGITLYNVRFTIMSDVAIT